LKAVGRAVRADGKRAAVVNFNNGDVTMTHASNSLKIAGGTLSVGADSSSDSLQVRANGSNQAIIRGRNNADNANIGVMYWDGSSVFHIEYASGSEGFNVSSSGINLMGQFAYNASGIVSLRSYTVGTVPTATAQQVIYVSNGTSNKRLAVADGTNWRWPDGAIVS
jgi:hypothetical protein